MCGSVQNNRPACPPPVRNEPPPRPVVSPERPVVSPERPLAVQNDRDNVGSPVPAKRGEGCGYSQRDSFEAPRNACAPKAQRRDRPLFAHLSKVFEKIEKYLPQLGAFMRGLLDAYRPDQDAAPAAERVQRQRALR